MEQAPPPSNKQQRMMEINNKDNSSAKKEENDHEWIKKSAEIKQSDEVTHAARKTFDPYNMNIEGPKYPGQVPCFVEVSKNSRNKYEWDHDLGVLCLDRVLHSAVYYPHDYGFIPQTLCGDGDPLDILVISTAPLIPGCVVSARPICYMVMEDEKGMDEKVLAVNAKDAHYGQVKTMADLHDHTLAEIAEFFASYKKLEKNKWAKIGGWHGTEETLKLIQDSHQTYLKKMNGLAGL